MADRATIVYGGLTDVSGSGVGGSTVVATLIATAQPNVTTSKDFVAPPTESVVTLSDPVAGAVSAPVLSLNAGAGAATAGTYHTAVAFVINGVETAVGASSNVVTASLNDGFHWASLPVGPAGTTARVLYRTLHGGSTLHQVATISDNTTPTYTDNTLSDAVLGATTVGLLVGGFRLTLLPNADLTPANTLYKIVIAGITYYTTSFSYSATPITLASILSVTGFTAPTVAMTMTVAQISGLFDAGDTVTVRLSQDAVSTISAEFFPAAVVFPQYVAADGTVVFNLPRNDQLNPSGTYYQGQVGTRGQPFYFTAIAGGGAIFSHLTVPMAPNSIALTPGGILSTLTPQIDDPTQSPTSLQDDIHNLDGRTKINSRTLTANTTLDAITDDRIFANGAGGIFTVTLPLVAGRHRPYTVIKTDSAHTITIAAHSGETINGAASITLTTQWGGVDIYPLGTGTWATKTSGSGGGTSTAAFDFVAKTTATYAIVTTDSGIGADASLNNQQITLPTAVGAVQQYAVKRVDNLSGGFTCVVNTTGGQTVEGLSQVALTVQNQGYIFGSDGANWRIVAGILPNPLSVAGTILYYDGANLAALTVGANLSITSNTLNAASATNSGGELIVQDGVTGPPVPLYSEDGSDFCYFG